MPLSFCPIGESVTVRKVGGDPALRQHLNELGFNEGTDVTVVSSLSGNIIVLVRNSRIALDHRLASRILV